MAKRTKVQLKTKVDQIIKPNGNREITPEKHNSIETDIIDSFLNVADGGFVIDQAAGYSSSVSITDDRQFASKKYVDDNSGGASSFSDLSGDPYDNTALAEALNDKQDALTFTPENSANKGQANGYTPLGSDSIVPNEFLSSDLTRQGEPLIENSFISVNGNGKIVNTGYSTSHLLKDISGTISIDANGNIVNSANISANKFLVSNTIGGYAEALTPVSNNIIRLGGGFSFVHCGTMFPATSGTGQLGAESAQYNLGFFRSLFANNIGAITTPLTIGLTDVGGALQSSINSSGSSFGTNIVSASNTGTGGSGHIQFLPGTTASGQRGYISIGAAALNSPNYRTDNAGSDIYCMVQVANGATSIGTNTVVGFDNGNNGIVLLKGNGTRFIARAAIKLVTSSDLAGSETGDIMFMTKSASGAISQGLVVDKNKNVIAGSPSITTTATDGFLYIPDVAGAPTGVPTSVPGFIPLRADSAANKIYAYMDGSWLSTTLS